MSQISHLTTFFNELVRVLCSCRFKKPLQLSAAAEAIGFFCSIFAQQTMAAHSDGISRDLKGQHFLLLYVVVNCTPVDINNPGGVGYPNELDVLPASLAPDFVPKNNWRSQFGHLT